MAKQGPAPAWVAGIHPRHDLKYDVLFSVHGSTVGLRLGRRLGNAFMKHNTVGSGGLLTWKRSKLVDWRPMPVDRVVRQDHVIGAPRGRRAVEARVFLSYPHTAAEDANWVATAFEAAGADVWHDDTHLRPGDSLPASIAQAIATAHVFVPLIDESWLRSDWCRRELDLAREHRTRVVPVQLHFGRLAVPKAVARRLADLGDPVVVNLRRPDANERLIDAAINAVSH